MSTANFMKPGFSFLFFAFFVIQSISGCFSKETEPIQTTLTNTPMPEFKLFLADSSTYFDTKNLPKNKPVVFFLFGPRCPYSRAQIQEITKNINKLKDIQFVICTTSPYHEMKWFYEHYELKKYQNVITGIDYNNFFRSYYNPDGVPYFVIYGKNKTLNEIYSGQTPISQIKKAALL